MEKEGTPKDETASPSRADSLFFTDDSKFTSGDESLTWPSLSAPQQLAQPAHAHAHEYRRDEKRPPSLRSVTRRIDFHVVPLLFLCYFLQFLDKVLINYANIMGLGNDLHFSRGANDFSWMATAFFIGYAIAELPQCYLIQRLPVTRVLGANVVLWGVVVCCTAAVRNFPGAAALRTLLGVLEAVITPALVMITSQWYAKRQATLRTGLWYCGLGAGQIIGGLISFAAQSATRPGASFQSWRVMFLAVGAFNVLVGAAVFFFLPVSIRAASFLSAEEKTMLEQVLKRDQAGNGLKVFRLAGLVEALKDLQVWLLFFNSILIVIPSGIITTFSATLIRSFGYTPKQSALLNMPSGAVSIISTLLGTWSIAYGHGGGGGLVPRWLSIVGLLVPTIIGAGLLSFRSDSQATALTGIYLINFDVAPLALVYAFAGANTQGYTKKLTTNAIIAIGISIANIIGPQTFREKDAPGYTPAKITVFGVCGGAIVITISLRLLYGYRNSKTRAAREAELMAIDRGDDATPDDDDDQTDMTNPTFRYVY